MAGKITKALKKQFEEKAKELCEEYNPYREDRERSIPYFIGKTPMFYFKALNKSLTKEQIDAEYIDTAVKDIQYGYEQRMAGYMDKWYRYNHADEGAAYEAGQRMAADTGKCPEEFRIIECMH